MQNKVVYFLKYILRKTCNVLNIRLLCIFVMFERKQTIS